MVTANGIDNTPQSLVLVEKTSLGQDIVFFGETVFIKLQRF
jgi:hypothetical protein